MEVQALIMTTARSMKNLDRKEAYTKNAIKQIEEQLKNPTNEAGTDTEKYLQLLNESKPKLEALLVMISDGRKELESILDKHGYDSRSVMAIASVMQDFV